KNYDSYLKRLVLSARPNVIDRMSSKYTSSLKISRAGKQVKSAIKGRTRVEGPEVSSNNDFTRRVLQEALQGDFKNDPLMLEAIIAREMVRTEPGLSPQMKELLNKKAAMSEMSAEFDREAKKRGGCFMYTRNEYNDKYVVGDFDSLFKIEIKSTLLHELGHALGLVHNFKGSFDKENFAFEGEKTDRNYSSIMDYVASPEITYAGPGTYDVHALRAIYTGLIEVSDLAKAVAEKDGGKISQGEFHAKVINGKFLQLTDVKAILGFSNWADMQKGIVDKSKLLKHYYQCDDEGVGEEPACERYDVGASATEIVKNEIQDYHRSYASRYHSYDRVNFGIEQKITIIKDMVENFKKIRRFLDDYFKMAIYGSALSKDEAIDFKEASYLGYDFFHEIVRIPDTTKPFGNTPDEISERLMVVPYTLRMPIMKDGSQVMDEKGNPKFEEHDDLKILEARRVYDYFTAPGSDRIDTIGIGLDKQFALQFLLLANPSGGTDDSHTGWIGYNEFEQYFLGVKNATESTNMRTLLEIMSNQLKPGFVDQNHD
ncbi:MAG TPA: zinc-dependent metalloprotease, partial [Bdellovibrio sp.]|nr:zinc-dependent metalloprotease [Bdellovibrio sp.]